ncbi:MAG: hypothetical protein WCL00_14995, partial [Bacteroidota bacterium]
LMRFSGKIFRVSQCRSQEIEVSGKNLFLFNGLLTLGVGIVLFFNPFAMVGFVIKMIGAFSLVFGCLLIYLSFILKKVLAAGEK